MIKDLLRISDLSALDLTRLTDRAHQFATQPDAAPLRLDH